MKMVRSLLLGSAAGFVAVAGAQAADMPVKAKPVEYVKICTLYGAGFYYLPGTDICVKHGAYVRFQPYYNFGNTSATSGPFISNAGQQTASTTTNNDLLLRSRAVYTMDARTQTEYGTLRAYVLIGYTVDSLGQTATNASLYATRGFIQFAGFTLGRATSFYDIWSVPANSYFAVFSSDTGDGGDIVASYTFQFGNGFSATLGAEDPRRLTVTNTTVGAVGTSPFVLGALPSNDAANNRWPDVVGNLRVDQAWGSFQIMGAIHDVSGAYFLPSAGITCGATAFGGTLTGDLACGRPNDEIGFAVGAGGIFKIPMPTGLTDIASFQFNYTEGASRYAWFTQSATSSPSMFGNTGLATCPIGAPAVAGLSPTCLGSVGVGIVTDGIFANPGALAGYDGSVQRTKVWGVNAAWDHLWTPNLKTSVYGAFIKVEYNNTSRDLMAVSLCNTVPGTVPVAVPAAVGTAAGAISRITGNCDPDFSIWQIGSRTQWNITPSFYVGFDVMYQKLETAFAGSTALFTAAAGLPRPTGVYEIKDQDTVGVTARVHWDILP
jgi:porin-like protein